MRKKKERQMETRLYKAEESSAIVRVNEKEENTSCTLSLSMSSFSSVYHFHSFFIPILFLMCSSLCLLSHSILLTSLEKVTSAV